MTDSVHSSQPLRERERETLAEVSPTAYNVINTHRRPLGVIAINT